MDLQTSQNMPRRRYPIGIQTFSEIRTKGYVYVDKTELVYRLAHADAKYLFLGRPRRFGKSLLVSTLQAYFSGQRELFSGLAIEKLETEWTAYPVLHFDMSMAKHADKEELEQYLSAQLDEWEQVYGVDETYKPLNLRLEKLIRHVFQHTGKQVVVLIDEYDAPLLDVLHEERDLPVLRNVMRNFYSPLKACDPYLRFVFLTGITKFSSFSIFSGLNNLKDISMDPVYAALCGITQEEIESSLMPDVGRFAVKMQRTREEVLDLLKSHYDGYHFCWPSPDVYNPYSLLNAFSDGRVEAYWFGSGTPTYLLEMMRKFQVTPVELGTSMEAMREDFDMPAERMTSLVPLLYQSGYVTIEGYEAGSELYTLGTPNREVRIGLMQTLLPVYVAGASMGGTTMVAKMSEAIRRDDMEAALRLLQSFLSLVPYCDNTDYEGHYQQVLYIIFSLLGASVDVEIRTPRGRVDLVLRTASKLYVMELKLGKDADAAMGQIDLKDYPERFALCGLPVVKVGIGFDREKHTLGAWKLEEVC